MPNRSQLLTAAATLFLAIVFLTLPAIVAARAAVTIQEVTSEKGIKAWLVEDYSVPIVSVRFAFSGGRSIIVNVGQCAVRPRDAPVRLQREWGRDPRPGAATAEPRARPSGLRPQTPSRSAALPCLLGRRKASNAVPAVRPNFHGRAFGLQMIRWTPGRPAPGARDRSRRPSSTTTTLL